MKPCWTWGFLWQNVCLSVTPCLSLLPESGLDQPGEYLWKPITLQRDSGKHWEQIPRKQPVVACSWVHPVLLGSPRAEGRSRFGGDAAGMCTTPSAFFFFFLLLSRRSSGRMFQKCHFREEEIILLYVRNRGSHPQMLSSRQLTRPPSVHIYHNLFQFNAIAHFSSVAVTSNGLDFHFTTASRAKEKEKYG